MNAVRAATVAAMTGGVAEGNGRIRSGAYDVSPVALIADHQWRTLFPYLKPTSRAQVVGQGSDIHFLSVTSYACDNPTGADLAVITPIYTPQLYDSYGNTIDGSPFNSDVQNLDITPGNTAAIGVHGQGGKRLPFINQLVPGRGIKPTPYGFYDYKKPPDSSIYIMTPPQGKNAPGTVYKNPNALDKVVNRPLIDVYLGRGLTYDTEDTTGFTPIMVKAGRGLAFSAPDPNDNGQRFLQVDPAGSGILQLAAGPAIAIDPPTPPTIASVTPVQTDGTGANDLGTHEYGATYTTTDSKESMISAGVQTFNSPGFEANAVVINAVPTPPQIINGLNLYRTKVVDTQTTFYKIASFTRAQIIAGISYDDNVADSALGAAYTGSNPSLVSVELATVAGANVSGLVENAGDDTNGLKVNVDGTTVTINSSNQLVASGGSGGGGGGASVGEVAKVVATHPNYLGAAVIPAATIAAGTNLNWSNNLYDATSGLMHDTVTHSDRFVVRQLGWYKVTFCGQFQSKCGPVFDAAIYLNDNYQIAQDSQQLGGDADSTTVYHSTECIGVCYAKPGDYFTAYVQQTANVSTSCTIETGTEASGGDFFTDGCMFMVEQLQPPASSSANALGHAVAARNNSWPMPSSTPQAIPWPTNIVDTDSFWTPSSTKLTVPVKGIYRFTAFTTSGGVLSGAPFEWYLNMRVNGADPWTGGATVYGGEVSSENVNDLAISGLVALNAGDYVEFYMWSTNSSAPTMMVQAALEGVA